MNKYNKNIKLKRNRLFFIFKTLYIKNLFKYIDPLSLRLLSENLQQVFNHLPQKIVYLLL